MATGGEEKVGYSLVRLGTVTLENADKSPLYDSIVVCQDKIVVLDWKTFKVNIHGLHDGELLASSNRLKSLPCDMCLMDAMTICVIHDDGLIKMMSIDSTDMSRVIKKTKTLRLQGVLLDRYDFVVRFKDNLVVTGVKQGMMYWCIVSLKDGHVDRIHQICKGQCRVTTQDNIIYISCCAGYKSPHNTGVYGFDILNPSQCKYKYKHQRLQEPRSIVINEDGNIFVCNYGYHRDGCIHQLTASCQLVAIFTQGIPPQLYALFWDNGRLYGTCKLSPDITVFQSVYQGSHEASEILVSDERRHPVTEEMAIQIGQGNVKKVQSSVETAMPPSVPFPGESEDKQGPIIPVEILRMDDKSLQLYKKALHEGKEKVYNLRVMVVGQFGVGKTTLTKRLLGKEVDISERQSTEGIDVYKHCCKISLDTGEWIVQHEDTEQDHQLQRIARVLIEKQSVSDRFPDKKEVEIPSQGERTSAGDASVNEEQEGRSPESNASVTDKERVKMDPGNEMLISGSNANVTADVKVIIPPQGKINRDSNKNVTDKENGNMDPVRVMGIPDTNANVAENRQVIIPPQGEITPDSNAYVADKEEVKDPMKEMLKLLQENANQLKQDKGKVSPLSVWDFAGQYAFYTTHQTFLTRRAIYLLVSDVSGQITDLVDDECFLDSEGIRKCRVHELTDIWLNSIHSCAPSSEDGIPPVILVGTHVDKITQKQLPAEGIELETKITSPATEQPTTSLSAAASTKEQSGASTIFQSVRKFFKPRKTKGNVEATPVFSMTGARSVPSLDQQKKKRKWQFWQHMKKERLDADTEKTFCADDYSTPSKVEIHDNPEILIALYDFKRNEPDELSFVKGDKLILIEKDMEYPGWWKARNTLGEVGLIPGNFVQTFCADDYSTPSKVETNNNPETLIALYTFKRKESDELSFSKGDKLILIEKPMDVPGWWKVRNTMGEVGLIPGCYVQSYRYELCERYFKEIRSYLRKKPTRFHLIDEDFALDNTTVDSKLEDLKRKIVEVASKQPYWGEEIPARWLPLEQELMKLKAAGVKVIPLTLLEDLNKAGAVQIATDELDLFLRFHHDIGTILYFSLEVLKQRIVLDPQWMINALKSLITAEEFVLKSALGVADMWYEFKQKGKMYPELIDAVWSKKNNPDFHDNKEHILLLMEQLNIIAKPRYYSEDGSEVKVESYYLAPCMLSERTPIEVISLAQHPEKSISSVLCYVFQGKFLPAPIFHRLLATCVAHWPIAKKMSENLIFCGSCVFKIDLHHRLTMLFRDYVIFAQVTRMGATEKNPSFELCISVQKFITMNLSSIIGHLGHSLRFDLFIQCPRVDGYRVDCLIPVEDLKGNEDVPCDFHEISHVIMSCDVLRFWFQKEDKEDGQQQQPTEQQESSSSEEDKEDEGHDDADTPITEEHINHARLCNALTTVCANALREILSSQVPVSYADISKAILANQANLTSRRQIRPGQWQNALLNKDQINLVFPDPQGRFTGTLDQFDISLLYTLIRNVSSVQAPTTRWGNTPSDQPRDTSLGASVERIRLYRNSISGHSVDGKISQQEFEDYWNRITDVLDDIENLISSHGYKEELEKRKNQVITPHEARELQKTFKEYKKQVDAAAGDIQSVLETVQIAVNKALSSVEVLKGCKK